jgi:hypothetical protein
MAGIVSGSSTLQVRHTTLWRRWLRTALLGALGLALLLLLRAEAEIRIDALHVVIGGGLTVRCSQALVVDAGLEGIMHSLVRAIVAAAL